MAYANSSNLIAAFDVRDVRDLASDTGTAVDEAALPTSEPIVLALERASGDVDAAAMVGKMYTESDLSQLTGNARSMLIGMVCDRAMAYLMRRRPEKFSDVAIEAILARTDKFLDSLRDGQRVFNVATVLDAGLPTIDGPEAVDYEEMNLITDRTHHFYPSRASRLPIGRA